MRKLPLNQTYHAGPTILIFAEGTILKPKSRLSIYDHNAYLPIGRAAELIGTWAEQGANILYCTSRRQRQAEAMAALLQRHGFVGAFLALREKRERYKTIVEALEPDVLIEDDCKSIGGAWQMCITNVSPALKQTITSIVVPEFKGIDHLPAKLQSLVQLRTAPAGAEKGEGR